jgi:four helix bundle protein
MTSPTQKASSFQGKRYERLQAWQACHDLVQSTYGLTGDWPVDERFGMVSQARRAAFSAAANIAEGAAKRGPKEFRRYLDVAIGSLAELSYCLRLAKDLGFRSSERLGEAQTLCDHASRVTWGLYRVVAKRAMIQK